MSSLVAPILGLVVLTDFRLLGGSRLVALIRTAAMQGVLLGLLTLAVHAHALEREVALFAAMTIAIKGFLLPRFLLRALRVVEIRREVEPLVGFNASLVMGAVALGISLLVGARFSLPEATSPLLVPVALFTLLVGLFLIVSRRKALTQVLGYLVFENGIYAFGLAVAPEQPLLVELGVLLDLFVAIFVMGIIVFHIQRTFDHIDVDRLDELSEEASPEAAARTRP